VDKQGHLQLDILFYSDIKIYLLWIYGVFFIESEGVCDKTVYNNIRYACNDVNKTRSEWMTLYLESEKF